MGILRFRCKDGQVDSTKAYCTECKAPVKLGGGISNMSAHVHRHHPLLLNKPFGKAKVASVRNPPGPAPIDSTGAGPSASTDSDVDPLTNLKMIWFPCLALVSEKYEVLFPFCLIFLLSVCVCVCVCVCVWFFFVFCFLGLFVVVLPPPPPRPHFKSTRIWEMFRLIN